MLLKKLAKKANKYEHISLTGSKWVLPSLQTSNAFYLSVDSQSNRIICNLVPQRKVAIFVKIENLQTSELHIEATLFDNSCLELVCFIGNTKSCKLNIESHLSGKNSEVNVRNIITSTDRNKNIIQTLQNHEAPYSKSSLENVAIMDGNSDLVFNGLIKIGHDASDSQSFQHTRAMLLSQCANVEIAPNLEISNNQVVCNHGAVVGQFDPAMLYYMRSRGIPTQFAQNMLANGCLLTAFSGLNNPIWETIANDTDERIQFLPQNMMSLS